MENLFTQTLEANNVSNPMQIDAIKKACQLSVALNRAIIGRDSKEINDLSKAYQNFIKTAKIDDLITASSQDVISNVAQLVQFIEESGFKMKFYDDVDRDIVDKSMKDLQMFLQRLVMDATSLDIVFETINSSLKKKDAMQKDAESYETTPLEDLYEGAVSQQNKEFDEELSSESIGDFDEKTDEHF